MAGGQGRPLDEKPGPAPCRAGCRLRGQGSASDEVVPRFEVDQRPEAHLVGRHGPVLHPHVGPVGDQPAFETLYVVGGARPDAEGRARRLHPVPELDAAAAVLKVKLIAPLLRPARPRQHQGNVPQRGLAEAEILQLAHPVPEERGRHAHRLRPLDRQRRDVGFPNRNVEPGAAGDGQRPKVDVAVGDRQPVAVLGQLQKDGIVDEPSVMVAERHVAPLADPRRRQVAWRQHLGQAPRIGACQLDLPLRGHVPHRHAVHQPVVFAIGVSEVAGDVHVVVDREAAHPIAQRGVEIGRLADVRPDGDLECHDVFSCWRCAMGYHARRAFAPGIGRGEGPGRVRQGAPGLGGAGWVPPPALKALAASR